MTEEELRDFARSCLCKTGYLTMWRARKVAAKVYGERGIKLYAYTCPNCGMVHLTKKSHGSSRLPYIAYRAERILWKKEHEDQLALGA